MSFQFVQSKNILAYKWCVDCLNALRTLGSLNAETCVTSTLPLPLILSCFKSDRKVHHFNSPFNFLIIIWNAN